MIQTVTGTIRPSELGVCSVHEHLCIDLSRIKQNPDTILDDPAGMRRELDTFRTAGGRSMVEVTNDGMGRNVRLLAELSKQTDVYIIASTGFYKDPYLPEKTKGWGPQEFASHIVDEVNNGIEGTGIYPGVIGEVGSSKDEIKPIERALLEGAGIAGKETGLPVTTHTTLGSMAMAQVELFDRIGLPMDRLIVGHQDLNPDREEVLAVVEAGAYVGFDTIGKTNYRSDEDRLYTLLYLWERGYGSRILLSADLTRKSHWKQNGGPGYDLVLREFVPKLREAGLTEADIHQLLVDNPARVFDRKEHAA